MGIVEQMFGVFTDVSEWIVSSIGNVTALFWNAESGLSFVGTLAIVGLGIAVVRMVVSMIRSWMQLRN